MASQQESSRRRPKHGKRRNNSRRPLGAGAPVRPFTEEQLQARRDSLPTITYPEQLPVSARRDEIKQAIADNQVVIIAGETGSGKTTQIPKMCLELGRGITGMIGHTQPRRIAARSVAERIAEELGTTVSKNSIIGYQVRFTDEAGPNTLVKLMTDGIVLAEIHSDPLLKRYDTIIVDEAHERSLNIDFILGYLARLLPKRPDLKVIITSATIDSDRFAKHFADTNGQSAPILEVSGRTYPVEIRYRPLDPTEDAVGTTSAAMGGAYATPGAVHDEDSDPIDQVTGIIDACDELMNEGPGDILVFLAGERDIRDTQAALIDHLGPRFTADGRSARPDAVEIVPLFSRLSAAEQHRVFENHRCRRIVLSTNVAETSLTVPGIRYVVDPGLARISRFSNRTKVQRLPIEPISQASANQRSGRCGRVADGVAIRLYSEADFEARPQYTEPEILRTSLAQVILHMAALGLGAVADFPFVDPPDSRAVRDGVTLLAEIGAIAGSRTTASSEDETGEGLTSQRTTYSAHEAPRLTTLGRRLAHLPVDPRLGRMLLESASLGCASEVLVIVAALSMQDVRERPSEHQEAADALHRRFADPTSDFLTYLNLWRYIRTQRRDLSSSAFRRMCRSEFLHYLRVREWQDLYVQLKQMARALTIDIHDVDLPSPESIEAAADALPNGHTTLAHADVAAAVVALGKSADTPDADAIHQSLLTGLLSNLGSYNERRREYDGARGSHFSIWPGSGLRKKSYDWVMTAELVETSRLFARTVAKIDPRWVEKTARHLTTTVYGEPYWSTRKGAAMVHSKVMLYGLTLAADRPATLASVGTDAAKAVAREMFIRHGLVEGGWHARHAFVRKNRELVEELAEVEHKNRTHGLLADDERLVAFYDARIPASVTSAAVFDTWWKNERRENPDLLTFTRDVLLPGDVGVDGFPDSWQQGDLTLGLEYVFEPGRHDDGVSVRIPVEVLPRVRNEGFDWLVEGMREELCVATIRALPKRVRRHLVPAPDMGRRIMQWMSTHYPIPEGFSAPAVSFCDAFAQAAVELAGVEVATSDFADAATRLPDHLLMGFVVSDGRGAILGRSTDLPALQERLASKAQAAVRSAVRGALEEAMAASGVSFAGASSDDGSKHAKRGRGGKRSQGGQGQAAVGAAGHDVSAVQGTNGVVPRPAASHTSSASVIQAGLVEHARLDGWPAEFSDTPLPDDVESSGPAGLVVRGYPAFIAEDWRGSKPETPGMRIVGLRIMATPAHQAVAHADGVVALALNATVLAQGRITSRWNAAESMDLAASPYPSTAALVMDMEIAAARAVAQRFCDDRGIHLSAIRTQEVFNDLVRMMRNDLEDEVYVVAGRAARALRAKRELDKVVSSNTSMALLGTLAEVKATSAALVDNGFITATPVETLQHLPRYLKAAAMRIDKASGNVAADDALAYQVEQARDVVEKACQRLSIALTELGDVVAYPPAQEFAQIPPSQLATVIQGRWMLEEFRVSLFAQTLGTPHKVSLKRISKLCADLF
ncbi:ATP-dependent RNA helicase HrpA [Actinomyces vulturis]|uniref:ATP-dependent RNA helicase HrpA n=1 Tax=Actinomyces vulturis TaxID=1857645 RepID=UPI00082C6A90|nr:ATP-dependent RNA helicase HrpA [Actinomyces vulturis]